MRAFISYSENDREFVERLLPLFREHGIEVLEPDTEVHVGSPVAAGIENAMRSSDLIILVVSTHSSKNSWKSPEWALAAAMRGREGKHILPIRLDEAELPYFLRDIRWLDIRDRDHPEQDVSEALAPIRGRIQQEKQKLQQEWERERRNNQHAQQQMMMQQAYDFRREELEYLIREQTRTIRLTQRLSLFISTLVLIGLVGAAATWWLGGLTTAWWAVLSLATVVILIFDYYVTSRLRRRQDAEFARLREDLRERAFYGEGPSQRHQEGPL